MAHIAGVACPAAISWPTSSNASSADGSGPALGLLLASPKSLSRCSASAALKAALSTLHITRRWCEAESHMGQDHQQNRQDVGGTCCCCCQRPTQSPRCLVAGGIAISTGSALSLSAVMHRTLVVAACILPQQCQRVLC